MPLFERNVKLGSPLKVTAWRNVAIGTWGHPSSPAVFGSLDMDISPALNYLEKIRQENPESRLTLTHLIGKAIAQSIEKHPQINCILRFGKLYPRKTIDIFFQVASDQKGADLSGAVVRDANRKSIVEIANDLENSIHQIRKKGDPAYRKVKGLMGSLPGLLVRPILNLTSIVLYSFNLWSPLLGPPKDSFGSIMVTNIGSLGLDTAYAPLVPYSRVPVVIAVGAVREVPVVRDGKVEVGKSLRLCATFDHRIMDGMHASHLVKTITEYFAHPELLEKSKPV